MKAGTTGTGARLAAGALAMLWLVLAALPARATEWETYLSDDFAGPDSMFYTGQAGEAYYSLDNGRYLIDGMNTGVDSLSALTDNLYYYYVEAQCELLDSTAGELAFSGVVFHYNKKVQGKLSYYVFYAYGDGYYGAKRVIGDQVEIVLPLARSEMLDPGRPNILAVDCQGTRFDLYINGRYVDGFTDVRVDGGGCGFYVSKFSKAAFDSFAVKVEHRGGGAVTPAEPVAVEGSGANAAEPEPAGMAPSDEPPGTSESGHSFLGYSAPVIPKDPNRPVYPWEVGVDKTGKGKKPSQPPAGEEVGAGDGGGETTQADNGSAPEAPVVAPPKTPPGNAQETQPKHGMEHPASQAAPERPATQLGPTPEQVEQRGAQPGQPAGSGATAASPSNSGGDQPTGTSIRNAGEPGDSGAVVLPEGEELLPDMPAQPSGHSTARPAPAQPQPAQPGHNMENVQLVPAEEADGLLEEAAPAQPAASQPAEPAPSAIGNASPALAASSVIKRVRTDVDAQQYSPQPAQPQQEQAAAQPAATTPPEPEPEREPVAPAPETTATSEPLPEPLELTPEREPEPAPAPATGDLSLFGDGTSANPPAEPQAGGSEQLGVSATNQNTVSLGKIEPQYGKLDEQGNPVPSEDAGAGASEYAPVTGSEPAPVQPATAGEPAPADELSLTPEAQPATTTTAPATPKPSAYFSGPGAVEVVDDFSSQLWPVSETGLSTYRYFGAAYEVDNLNADTMAISFQEQTLGDTELSVGAEFLDGASYVGYGVAARFKVGAAGVSYYGLFISRSGEFLLLKVVDGAETVLKDWTASTLINPSLANKITLEIVGSRLTAYVNGTAVASVTDSSLTAGGYALLAGPGVKVRYDNLLLRGYPAK